MPTEVRLFGSPSYRAAGGWLPLPLDKRGALLTYLACSQEWVGRERLSFLFWPDTHTSRARINLRQLLARTKALDLEQQIEAEDDRVRWLVDSDVRLFREAVAEADWRTALLHYHGEFAAGLTLDDASEFGNWLEFERSQLSETHRQAALQAAEAALALHKPEEAAALYERLLIEDSLDETIMQLLLKLLVRMGAVEEAARRLQRFGQRLREELGSDPAAETLLIVADSTPRPEPVGESAVRTTNGSRTHRARLSVPLTSFVGREQELVGTVDRLGSEPCRLLTLVGPGGVGKTRLALRAAQALERRFAHGFVAVPLDQVSDTDGILFALAAALNLELRWQRPPLDQLVEYLEQRSLLLVLDSFEHLIDGAHMVKELLDECSRLKVLVTSRQRLRLQGEWLLPLGGMNLPPESMELADSISVPEALEFDALVLLNERARQVAPGFALSPGNLPTAIHICRMLEGLPLGIELAAGWLRTHSLEQVRTTLATSLGELSSDATDALGRHRTLRAVIDHSWRLLTAVQRSGFRSLAVFEGGFDRAAARAVAGVSLPLLRALCERSLLVGGESGRFGSHILIRRYMEERLDEEPSESARLRDAHADHYVRLLSSWSSRLHGPEQPEMLERLGPDYANLRAAWLNALERGWARKCLPAVEPLVLLHGLQGRFREGEQLFGTSLERFGHRASGVPSGHELLAYLEVNHAWFLAGLARFEEAAQQATSALLRAEDAGPAEVEVRALNVLGSIASRRGENETAEKLLVRGLQLSEALGDGWSTGLISGQLGLLALRSGDLGAAGAHFDRALAINEALGNAAGIVNDLDYLGRLRLASGHLAGAAAAFERGLALAEGSHFRLRLPYLKTQLAAVKLALGASEDAAALAQEALSVAEELGQRALQAEALTVVGQAAPNENEKYHRFRQALALSDALGDNPRTLELLVHLAQLPAYRAYSPTLLQLVVAHPATRAAQREQARTLMSRLGAVRPEPSSLPTLEDTVRSILA